MNEEAMRKAFEALCAPMWPGSRGVFALRDDGEYENRHVQFGWVCYRAATRAAVPVWQTIETAPVDGSEFLGYRRGRVAGAYRVLRDDCEMWSFGNESGAIEHWPEVKPTHWMPLPPAPESKP